MSVSSSSWETLCSYSQEFTCYSAAVATWAAIGERDWRELVSPGLWLRITEADDGLLGFGYFPTSLRAELGLERRAADSAEEAIAAIHAELARSGRVIVAGDGYRLPWHVAHARVHAPHWFVLAEGPEGLEVADPFACRNELGLQEVARQTVPESSLSELVAALPGDDPVHRLREVLALGDELAGAGRHPYEWFENAEVPGTRDPGGHDGPAGVLRLARHFRERGGDAGAYAQADDIWSIARHRAFTVRYASERAGGDGAEPSPLADWVREHGAPLAKRWGHIAPLIMQARLSLRAGREPSSSVPDTLEQLAEMEHQAALARDRESFTI